eukprot:14780551-Ditylum_brightwellii.AAC.2
MKRSWLLCWTYLLSLTGLTMRSGIWKWWMEMYGRRKQWMGGGNEYEVAAASNRVGKCSNKDDL